MNKSAEIPKLGLLNIMPSAAYLKTEHQWRETFGETIEIVPVCLNETIKSDDRILDNSEVYNLYDINTSLDGIIITGANLELNEDGSPLPFDNISYINKLREVIDWSSSENKLSIYSCLASHIALNHLFGIDREIQLEKTFGVFKHQNNGSSWLLEGLSKNQIISPHSRWGRIATKFLVENEIEIISESDQAGWLLAESNKNNNRSIFIQGHPEYQRDDLKFEFIRDIDNSKIPINYFDSNDPKNLPIYSWAEDTRTIFKNISNLLAKEKYSSH